MIDREKSVDVSSMELLPGFPASDFERFGVFTDVREAEPGAKTALFMKHVHWTKAEGVIMRSKEAFAEFLAHQDAVYGGLVALSESMADPKALRVVVEAFSPATPLHYDIIQSIANVQKARDRGTFRHLEEMRVAMTRNDDNAESTRLHLHGVIRFLSREVMAQRGKVIVPGRTDQESSSVELLKTDVNQLAFRSYERKSIDEEELQHVVERAALHYREDHERRHAFVRDSLEAAVPAGGFAAVPYGQAHFSGGSTPVAIEDAFVGWRVLVFEPSMLHECMALVPPDDSNILDVTNVTTESVRQAIVKALPPGYLDAQS